MTGLMDASLWPVNGRKKNCQVMPASPFLSNSYRDDYKSHIMSKAYLESSGESPYRGIIRDGALNERNQ
jgi:hypothetical protein